MCRTHVAEQGELDVGEFDAFESECLDVDALALVEYAIGLQTRGCQIDLSGGRRRLQGFLGQYLGGGLGPTCPWDDLNDLAHGIDLICCADGNCAGGQGPASCDAGCAVALHQFQMSCGASLAQIFGDESGRMQSFQAVEQECVDAVDPRFFLHAIETAVCDDAGDTAQHLPPPPPPPGSSQLANDAHSAMVDHMPETLIAYWPLDGNGADLSGNNIGGQPVNAEFVTGLWGSAFFFDGDDAVVVPDQGS
eukprot:COSAG04_NODE_7621_length_1096_cov_1.500502_2_plen_249_part_01